MRSIVVFLVGVVLWALNMNPGMGITGTALMCIGLLAMAVGWSRETK